MYIMHTHVHVYNRPGFDVGGSVRRRGRPGQRRAVHEHPRQAPTWEGRVVVIPLFQGAPIRYSVEDLTNLWRNSGESDW